MRVRDMLMIVILVVSLGANAWLVNTRLEEKFYQKGVQYGSKTLANQVIAQVEKTGRLTVTGTDGRNIPMQVVVPEAPPLQPIPPGATTGPIK